MPRRIPWELAVLLTLAVGCEEKQAPPPPPPSSAPAPPPAPAPSPTTIDPTRLAPYLPLPKEAVSDSNPITDEKVELGHRLFFETRLSSNGKVSCESCHVLENYGVDGLPQSKGASGKTLRRNTPTVFNSAVNSSWSWDARSNSFEDFLKAHAADPDVLGFSEARLAPLKKTEYAKLFAAAAPASKTPVSGETAIASLGAYLRRLMTPAPWDQFLGGDKSALSDDQKIGFNTFVSTGCLTCHAGANVGGQLTQKLGLLKPWPEPKTGEMDLGKFTFTKDPDDKMMFRSAPLRNIEKTGPYSMDGSIPSLLEMSKTMADHQLSKQISDADARSIIAFLSALTGELPKALIAKPAETK